MSFIVTGGYWEDQGYYESYSDPQFDAGARTIIELAADGGFSFTVKQAVGIICGLNNVDNDADYLEIEHAFYIENGQARVVENGVFKTGFSSYSIASVFLIERIGGVVSYRIDGVLKYTSLLASSGTVFLDCSLFAANDTVSLENVLVYNSIEPLSVALPKPVVNFLETSDTSLLIIEIGKPTLYIEEELVYELFIGVPSPQLTLLVEGENQLIFELPQPTIYIRETLIVPDYAILQFSVPTPQLRLNEDENLSLGIALPTPSVVLSEVPDFCHLTLPAPLIGFQEAVQDFILGDWPTWTLLAGNYVGEVVITPPAPILDAAGTVSTTGARLKLPEPVVTAYGGAITALRVPSPILTTATTQIGFATVAVTLPEPILTASGFSGIGATAVLEMPDALLTAQGGAVAAMEASSPTLAATGTVSQLATVALQMPLPDLSATGTVAGIGRVAITLPEPLFYAGIGNHVALEVPMVVLTSSGRVSASVAQNAAAAAHAAAIIAQAAAAAAIGTPGEVAALEAEAVALAAAVAAQAEVETTYAVNLSTGAVTTLLLGGFDKLVSAHGRLYGLKDGALTRLEGEVDGTDTPIPVTIRFAPSTFGTNFVKRMPALYLSMREYDGATLELVADEIKTWRYRTNTDTAPAYGTHRFSLGAGVKFHTAGLILKNRNGGKFSLGGLDPLIEVLSRRPR